MNITEIETRLAQLRAAISSGPIQSAINKWFRAYKRREYLRAKLEAAEERVKHLDQAVRAAEERHPLTKALHDEFQDLHSQWCALQAAEIRRQHADATAR